MNAKKMVGSLLVGAGVLLMLVGSFLVPVNAPVWGDDLLTGLVNDGCKGFGGVFCKEVGTGCPSTHPTCGPVWQFPDGLYRCMCY